jgi:hypothetical protein
MRCSAPDHSSAAADRRSIVDPAKVVDPQNYTFTLPPSRGAFAMTDAEPKLHIDSDWKAQAQAEKEKLAAAEAKVEAAKGERGADELPPADFRGLVGMLASQAIMGLGAMQDPKTGRVVIDLEGARFSIDLLGMLDEKTKGNLTPEEAEELGQILGELRSRYVQIAKLVAAQMAAGTATAAPSEAPSGKTTPGGLHIP